MADFLVAEGQAEAEAEIMMVAGLAGTLTTAEAHRQTRCLPWCCRILTRQVGQAQLQCLLLQAGGRGGMAVD